MYLQSLEIIGFKSFAPKTILNFHRGVTAIVGPNGCGKSNVLDSIRWVLGEQSAKALRGGEMSDVIFSGTDSRPALGMAEVSMTFAECEKELGTDWNEVRITRRVYRDGKSEYFLNKTVCRLKDIHQLFMDTGVGRSAYSIMEQGKIDLILSSRPEDRRAIFEEAAGITKYKSQKKEALRKLEYTEVNLVRVQDIIKEVKRQIGSLQRQAGKARRYQALMQDLRTFDSHLSHRNYRDLAGELENLKLQLTQGESAKAIHEEEITAQETELAGFRQRLDELDSTTSAAREGLQMIRNRIFSAESRIQTNGERTAEAATMIDRHRAEIAQAEEKIRTQQEQIEQTDSLLGQMIETLRGHEQSLNDQNEKVRAAREERVSVERQIQETGGEISRLEARLGSLRGDISAAAGRRESGETRLRLLQGESEAATQLAGELASTLSDLMRRTENARLGLEQAQAEVAEATNSHETAQQARQNAEAVLSFAGKEAAGIESRLEVLRQLQEQGEGFDEGTQSVLHGLDNPSFFSPAIQGALAQNIQVEPRFIPAVEAALGSALQAIVFKDPGVAESALLTLSRNKLGRANVIPTDWISRTADHSREVPFGVLGRASECIGGTGDAVDLARHLLAGVLIVETLEEAFRLRPLHPAFAYATLQGEFVALSGIVQGGVSGENTGQSALQRKAQIAQLDQELAASTVRLENLAGERARAGEALDLAAERLKSAREIVQSSQIEAASLENERRHFERQLADAEAKRSSFNRETASIEDSLRASLAHLGELETTIAQVSSGLDGCRTSRGEAEMRVQVARERESAASDALNEIRVRVATERQQQENLNRQRGPMAARVVELSELLDERRVDITNYERRIESLEAENTSLNISIAEWKESLGAEEANLEALVASRAEVLSGNDAVETALRAARAQLIRIQEERGRIDVKSTQAEMRMENIRNHVSHRYQLDLESFQPDTYSLLVAFRERGKKKPGSDAGDAEPAAAPVEEEEVPAEQPLSQQEGEGIPWERIEEIVAELTERIESMGPVNVDAIQEFDELEERFVFLEKQNADLVNSKAELLEVISKINRTTKELFAETFEKIRVNFQEMFTELFGGGRANLMLVDDSDPLESGIEIIAKPPGKQLQSVSLLSGGERTMTAVSLLFAIYMVKPSPFCVLDEMDAPLDESNISRFVKILDRFVGQSQFVVITHNKRTISRADMLYGVTMEEHGVSKLVSVKFSGRAEGEHPEHSIADTFGKSRKLGSEQASPAPEAEHQDFLEEPAAPEEPAQNEPASEESRQDELPTSAVDGETAPA
ncbi:MAG: chromosome segregation protein SMC [Verrucomicrobia bacterium]|nr:chromosome segregation protein SMC [Verrucomicrobiota bacterium]